MATKKDKKLAEDLLILKRVLALRDVVEKFVTEYDPERDSNEVAVRLEALNKVNKEFHHVLSEIEQIDAAEKFDQHIVERTDFENRFCRLKGFLLSKYQPRQPLLNSTMLSSFTPSHNSTSFHHRLPKIDLTKFSGDESRWISFRDSFMSMIHSNDDIPMVNKLQYLLQSLEGDAKKPFESVDIQANNYASTWDALMKRYDNKRFLRKELFRGLFDLPTMKHESALELNTLVDNFQRHVKALSKLGEPIEHWDTPLTFILCNKLDATTLRSWEHETRRKDDVKYDELIEFLIQQVRMLKSVSSDLEQRSQAASAKVAGPTHKTSSTTKYVVNAATTEFKSNTPQCYACSQMHQLHQCPTFIKLSVSQRRELVNQQCLCWNCFRPNHNAKLCKSKFSCRTCQAKHHTMLHDQAAQTQVTQAPDIQASSTVLSNPPTQQPTPSTAASVGTTGSTNPPEVNLSVQSKQSTVLLETVSLTIVDKRGTDIPVRALLDSAAMSNIISERLANHLAAREAIVDVEVTGIGESSKQIKRQLSAVIKSRTNPYSTTLEFLVMKKPTANLPTAPIDTSTWKIPKDPLADPFFNEPGMVDLIIGGECYHEIHTGQRKPIGDGLPYAVETLFGWTVAGKVANTYATVPPACYLFTVDKLQQSATEHCKLEADDHAQPHSAEEKLTETLYANTTTRPHSGRYAAPLPRSEDPQVTLGNSRSIATSRLERRLEKDPTVKHHQFTPKPQCYRPHQPVFEEASTTTIDDARDRPSCADNGESTVNTRTQVSTTVNFDEFSLTKRTSDKLEALADVSPKNRAIQPIFDLQDAEEYSWNHISGTKNPAAEHGLPPAEFLNPNRSRLSRSPYHWPQSNVSDEEAPATVEEAHHTTSLFRCTDALRVVARHSTEETLNTARFATADRTMTHLAQQQLYPDDIIDPSRSAASRTQPERRLKSRFAARPYSTSSVDCWPVNFKSPVRRRLQSKPYLTNIKDDNLAQRSASGLVVASSSVTQTQMEAHVSPATNAADNVVHPDATKAMLPPPTEVDNDHQKAETTKTGRADRNSLDAHLDSYQISTATSSLILNLSSLRPSGQYFSEWPIQVESHR